MTDTDPRIAIAKAKGWYLTSNGLCSYWTPPTGSECAERGVVHLIAEGDSDAKSMPPAPEGMKPCSDAIRFIPNYPADSREFMPLFFELPQPASITHDREGIAVRTGGMVYRDDDLGRAVCMAWLAWKGVG